MSLEQQIEGGLRQRPSDERIYTEPLAVLTRDGERVPVRMTRVAAARSHRGAVPALTAVVVALALGAVALVGLPRGSAGQPGASGEPGAQSYALTGRIACFGQGPGYDPNETSPLDEGCQLMAVPPDGYGAASWTLDPSATLSAESTEVHILVSEMACAGGSSADGRIVQNVRQSDGEVIVTVAARSLTGAQTCQGNPPTAYVLRLDQPVGSRDLFDGGLWPAQLISRAGVPAYTPSPIPSVPTTAPSIAPVASFRLYTVVAGDFMTRIAARNNLRLCELLAANPDADPNHIEPGQWLNIPEPGTVACATPKP